MKRYYVSIVSTIALITAMSGCSPQAAEPTVVGGEAVTEKPQAAPVITVYKNQNCGCCKEWAAHLEDNGFVVEEEAVSDLQALKQRIGIPPEMASCHTAVVDGFVVEGHVPASDIKAYLADPVAGSGGLAVPGMPHGTPGMETGRKDSFEVLLLTADGKPEVFKSYDHD